MLDVGNKHRRREPGWSMVDTTTLHRISFEKSTMKQPWNTGCKAATHWLLLACALMAVRSQLHTPWAHSECQSAMSGCSMDAPMQVDGWWWLMYDHPTLTVLGNICPKGLVCQAPLETKLGWAIGGPPGEFTMETELPSRWPPMERETQIPLVDA